MRAGTGSHRESNGEEDCVQERVTIEMSADGGSAVVHIAPSRHRRLFYAAKSAAVGLVVVAALTYFDIAGIDVLLINVALALGVSAALGLAAYYLSGEKIRVDARSATIVGPFGAGVVARAEQAAPVYSPLPENPWSAQRRKGERGSGVLQFGAGSRSVRFGSDLSEDEARFVISAFDIPADPGPARLAVDTWSQRLARIAVAVAPFAIGLGFLGVLLWVDVTRTVALALGCVALAIAAALLLFAERGLPRHLVLVEPTATSKKKSRKRRRR
jgi:hypothetical protein